MGQDDYQNVLEARCYAEGIESLLCSMEDTTTLEQLKPFELVLLIQPITERLNKVLKDRPVKP